MSITSLSERMLQNEMAAILMHCLDTENVPEVSVRIHRDLCLGDMRLIIGWSGQQHVKEITEADLGRSLDDFATRFMLPAAMELCGLPLMDAGRIVVNAAHDERGPA